MGKKLTKRKKQSLRYPLNLYCEGQQEELYFERLKVLINNDSCNIKKIDYKPYNCGGSSSIVIVETAIRLCPGTQTPYIVFDHDLKERDFCKAIDLCLGKKGEMGYSNLNFDYFLVLHKCEGTPSVSTMYSNDAYEKQLKKLYGITKNEDIKQRSVIKKIVEQITIEDVKKAISKCYWIDDYNKNNRMPINTPCGNHHFDNPDFTIHELVDKVIKNTLSK